MAWDTPKVDWGSPDGVGYADMNRIEANILYIKESHMDIETVGIHGSTNLSTASKLMHRDASGRARVENPDDDKDIVNKQTLVAHSGDTDNPHATDKTDVGLGDVTNHAQMPIAGGTFTGPVYGDFPDTSYTTAMHRNIKLLESVPGAGDLENGEIAFVYE